MTPSEQWILGLFAVYAIPAFLLGVGTALMLVRWQGRRRLSNFLSPDLTFAPSEAEIPLSAVPVRQVIQGNLAV